MKKKSSEERKMYFCVMSEKNISAGETLVLGTNSRGDLVCCFIDGTFVGFVSAKQPEGCMSFWDIASSVGKNRVLCKVANKGRQSAYSAKRQQSFYPPRIRKSGRTGLRNADFRVILVYNTP